MGESVISWNLANLITIGLMLALIWVFYGALSHLFRKGGSNGGLQRGNLAGNGNVAGDNPSNVVTFVAA